MDMKPNDLPDIVEGETKTVTFKLKPGIGNLTVSAVAFESIPSGLTFANESYTAESSTTVSASVTGSTVGTYIIVATSTLSNGDIDKSRVRLRVRAECDL